ncbi:uncharacterized protein [Cicer arietinum]|uniref:F-box protein At3g17480 n=1 Tax=Cicer arietinum TaxID=3827 RepID=A0A1S2XD50_CICAR|nr:putative F-box protein At3g17480 [Cicer arietinum]
MTIMTRKRRRMMAEATAESPSTVLPEELMIEILSRVESSNPLQLRCVCKWWKSLIVDPQFVKKHLNKSFTDITDLASKAMDHMNSFEMHLIHAPAVPQDEEEEEENDEDDDDDDEEEEKQSMMNLVAQLDNLLIIVRSLKGNLETIKVDMQALKDRMKCLENFLQIYLKNATASSS